MSGHVYWLRGHFVVFESGGAIPYAYASRKSIHLVSSQLCFRGELQPTLFLMFYATNATIIHDWLESHKYRDTSAVYFVLIWQSRGARDTLAFTARRGRGTGANSRSSSSGQACAEWEMFLDRRRDHQPPRFLTSHLPNSYCHESFGPCPSAPLAVQTT
jgi:hypothetical protein